MPKLLASLRLRRAVGLTSETVLDQRVLNAHVRRCDDDEEIVGGGRCKGGLPTTSGVDIEHPFALCERRIGLEANLKRVGIFAHVLFPLNVSFTVREGGPDIVRFVVQEVADQEVPHRMPMQRA